MPTDDPGVVEFLLAAIKVRRPVPIEPTNDYSSLQEALYFLRTTTHMTIAELAFRVGISENYLSNVEASMYHLNVESMEVVMQIAQECGLRKMVRFMHLLIINNRNKPRRGRKSGLLTLSREPEPLNRRSSD